MTAEVEKLIAAGGDTLLWVVEQYGPGRMEISSGNIEVSSLEEKVEVVDALLDAGWIWSAHGKIPSVVSEDVVIFSSWRKLADER